jgi:hypothetical protein
MAARDLFFRIEVERLGNPGDSLDFKSDGSVEWPAAQLPVTVRVYWPHNVPVGDQVREVEASKQSIAIFNISIPRT